MLFKFSTIVLVIAMIMIALTVAASPYGTEGRTFKKDKYKTKGKPMKGYDSGYGSSYGSSYGSGYNTGSYGSYEGHGGNY